ncbi:MAG: type III-B CRISPR module RAMP protein Cmr6 [Methylococcaceae bacterium]
MPNLIVNMRRELLTHIDQSEHAGLLLDKGFSVWAENAVKKNEIVEIKQHNNATHDLHIDASNIVFSPLYEKAYQNWKQYHIENSDNSCVWFGALVNRLFLGMGESSPLEAGITLHHTYGVPIIPGSAVKGVLSHFANEIGLSDEIKTVLFGREDNAISKQDRGEAGCIIFNDAWWIPKGKSLVPEMITVHAQQYYKDKGRDAPHPDFESPNPNPQIAIQGGFLFSVEGDKKWVKYVIKFLAKAMQCKGLGAKKASGYGYFTHDRRANDAFADEIESIKNEQDKIIQQATLEKKISDMSAMAGDFFKQVNNNNWETDKNAFWTPKSEGVEFWVDKLEENNDDELRQQIEVLMEIHFNGVLKEPDKAKGKKFVYKDRVRAIAKRLIALR